MDSRLRGNDGMFFPGIGVVGQWIPAFAGMTGLVSLWGYVTSGLSSTCHSLNILQKTQHRNGRFIKKTSTKINERIKYPSQRPCRHQSDDHA